jgi:hypothetical protein
MNHNLFVHAHLLQAHGYVSQWKQVTTKIVEHNGTVDRLTDIHDRKKSEMVLK